MKSQIKIPKTTKEKPYIEFKFDKKGNLYLRATSSWWGGISGGFTSTDGCVGNTCYPNKLNSYLKSFKKRRIKEVELRIKKLQIELENLKNNLECNI